MKKRITFIFIFYINLFCIHAEQIISGFGLFYKTSYNEGIKLIKTDGFTIISEGTRKNTNTDRKMIYVGTFEYDGIPYKNGTFSFDRAIDGSYYFTIAEGDVDLEKIQSDDYYKAQYIAFLKECSEMYLPLIEEHENNTLIGYKGDNGGYILLSFTDKLHIIYFPKEPK